MKQALVSIDFDFFVREDPRWDWNHGENGVFFEAIWPIRYAGMPKLAQETDPRKHADFPPTELYRQLLKAGLFLNLANGLVMSAESHVTVLRLVEKLGPLFQPELVLNLDAHHDLYHEKVPRDCGNWWVDVYDRWPNARHVHVYPRWLEKLGFDDPHYGIPKPVRPIEQLRWDQFTTEPMWVVGLFLCRSGAWVPPHLDKVFNRMTRTFASGLTLNPRELPVDEIKSLRKAFLELKRQMKPPLTKGVPRC